MYFTNQYLGIAKVSRTAQVIPQQVQFSTISSIMAANPPIQTQTAGIQAALPTVSSQVQASSSVADVVSQPLPLIPDV